MARLHRFRGGAPWALNYYPARIANAEKCLAARPTNYSSIAHMYVSLACVQYGVGHELAQVRDSLRKSVEAFVALFQNAKRVDPSIVNPGKAVLGVMTALVANEPPQAREIAVSGDCPQKRLSEVYANWQFLLRALQALGRGDDEAARGELAKVVDLEPLDWFPSLRDTLLGIVERSASRFRDAIDLVLAVYQRDFEREDGVLEKYDLCVPAMGLSMLALERELVALPELPASGPVYARDLLEYLLAEGRDDAR
ncbi:MAG: hypothetical protein U0793_22565 [Gemmataceae bacterium]